MARKPNKRQRTNERWREERAVRTAIPTNAAQQERRALAGFEDAYEITRSGEVWSRRLRRFIKHTYDPIESRTYIRITRNGKRVNISTWRAIIASWMSEEDQDQLRRCVPAETLGSLIALRERQSAIQAVAREFQLDSQVLFAFLLAKGKL